MPKFENIFVIMFSFLGMEHAKNSYFYFHRTLLSLSLQSLSISNYVINYTGTENRQRKLFKVKVTLFFNSLKNKKKLCKILDIVQSRFHTYCLIWTAKKIIQPSSAFPPLYRDFYRPLGTKNVICSFS